MAKSIGARRWKQMIDKLGLKLNVPILLLMIKYVVRGTESDLPISKVVLSYLESEKKN